MAGGMDLFCPTLRYTSNDDRPHHIGSFPLINYALLLVAGPSVLQ
ncbi:hypothetical protein CCACVL1_07836 [Corchorus capsularis]|uniref:Uncharacterized protein n=1 Tax=Corchorus capsularis TaxID=210143 RepID=A0A1R3J3L7_COCAP|nr:hypothetical protein CCACVL1_07836 [Corchorus capsularis]